MDLTPPAAVTDALIALLDGTCTITRPSTTFNRSTHALDHGAEPIFAGPCALLSPSTRRSGAGADDRTVETRPLRLPLAATGVMPGDLVVIDGVAGSFVVDELLDGSTVVDHRVRLVATADAPGVPS